MQLDAKALAAATAEIVRGHVAAATAPLLRRIEALEARPAPERGEKGDPGEGIPGRDGVGLADALIDREGVLVLTLTSGEHRRLGVVVGKDGTDGAPGEDGTNGTDGAPGRDGFSLDDFECAVAEDDRTILLKFRSGEYEYETGLKFPTVLDRGVYKAGESYQPGDAVTWGGSLWIAQRETDAKPDSPDSGFRLAVKKGRDGKDAK